MFEMMTMMIILVSIEASTQSKGHQQAQSQAQCL